MRATAQGRGMGLWVSAGAYLVWVLSLWAIKDTLWFGGVAGEAVHYDYLAFRTVSTGQFLGGATEPIGPPFLLLYLIGVYSVFGRSFAVLRLLGALWGAVLAYLAYRLGRRIGGETAGVLSGVLMALSGPVYLFELTMPGTALYLCFFLLALDRYADGLEQGRSVPFLAGGLAMSVATLARPSLGVAGMLLGAYLLLRRAPWMQKWRQALALLAGALLVMLPVSAMHQLRYGSWMPTLAYGYGLHLGYHDGATGRQGSDRFLDNSLEEMDFGAYRLQASLEVGQELTYAEASRHWANRAWQWIKANPWKSIELTLFKLAASWEPHEFPIDANYYFYRQSGLIPLTIVSFGLLLACSLPLVVLTRRLTPGLVTVALAALGCTAGTAVLFVASRYRLPLVPLVAVCSGPGLITAVTRWRANARLDRPLLMAAGVLGVALVLWPNPYGDRSWTAQDYGMAANILATQGKYREATRWMEQMLSVNPDSVHGWAFLGDLREKAGDLDGALQAYEEVLRRQDKSFYQVSPRMYVRLGDLYMRKQQYPDAAAAYRGAIDVNRYYRAAYGKLTEALLQVGDQQAADAVRTALSDLK